MTKNIISAENDYKKMCFLNQINGIDFPRIVFIIYIDNISVETQQSNIDNIDNIDTYIKGCLIKNCV